MKRLSFTAAVCCHDADPNPILTNLLEQTRRPDEILMHISDPPRFLRWDLIEDIPGIRIFFSPNMNDWGHEKRAQALDLASCDVIGWFNHDDAYEPTYIEVMMDAIEQGADVAYCNWTFGGRDQSTINHDCEFRAGNSTSGNWIGRTGLIRSVGYPWRDYSADGHLINAVAATKPLITKVSSPLYHHNA